MKSLLCSLFLAFAFHANAFVDSCQAYFTAEADSNLEVQFFNQSSGQNFFSYWTFGDGNTSYEQNPQHTYTEPNWYAVCLTIYDSLQQCESTYCDTIQAVGSSSGPCTADFRVEYGSNGQVFFVNQSSASATNFSWNFGDGSPQEQSYHVDHTYSQTGYYQVCLTAWGDSACQAQYCDSIYVEIAEPTDSCQAYFTAHPDSNLRVEFWNQSEGQAYFSYWTFGDGNTSYQQNPQHTYTEPNWYAVCLTIYDSLQQCESTYCDTVQAVGSSSGPCTADFRVEYGSNGQVFFVNQSSSSATNFSWNFGDGSSTEQSYNADHTYSQTGYYQVCLTAWGDSACQAQYCDSIYVEIAEPTDSCQAYFTAHPDSNLRVEFWNQSEGQAYFSYWTFGDGNTSYEQNPQHTYAEPGWYAVCLTIYDSLQQCESSYCDSIQAIGEAGPCTADFRVEYGANGRVYFVNESSALATNFTWNFGDGSSPEGSYHADHTYPETGYFEVCLTAWNNNGCQAQHCDSIYVEVPEPGDSCQAYFTAYPDSNLRVEFVNQSGGQLDVVFWTFGDGNNSYETHPEHVYAQPGWYVVCLTIFDSIQQCESSYCDTIQALGDSVPCVADFRVEYGNNGQVFFVNESGNTSNSYAWSFGDGSPQEQSYHADHTYPETGYYQVCLTAWNNNGCQVQLCDSIYVEVPEPGDSCQAYFTAHPDSNLRVEFWNQSEGQAYFSYWTFGDGTSSYQQHPEHSYSEPGWYQVCLTIYDSIQQCESSYCDSVQAIGQVGACEVYFEARIGSNGQVFFENLSSGFVTDFNWDFGDGSPTMSGYHAGHEYEEEGYYQVCLTGWNNNGCQAVFCDTIFVPMDSNWQCEAHFEPRLDSMANNMQYWSFENQSQGENLIYYWNFGDGTYATTEHAQKAYPDSLYDIQVCLAITALDSNQSFQCADSVCYTFNRNLGLNSSIHKYQLDLFPNPVNEQLNVHGLVSGNRLEIFDLSGRQWYSEQVGQATKTINLEHLPPGYYLLYHQGQRKTFIKLSRW